MTKRQTALVLVVDDSGSMSGLARETETGVRKVIADAQSAVRQEGGDAILTVVRFNTEVMFDWRGARLLDVDPASFSVNPSGYTALLDAVGKAIAATDKWQAEEPNRRVAMTIVTDGADNASKEYKLHDVKSMITQRNAQRTPTGEPVWEIEFLAANLNAVNVGTGMGINPAYAANVVANSVGAKAVWAASSDNNVNVLRGGVKNASQAQYNSVLNASQAQYSSVLDASQAQYSSVLDASQAQYSSVLDASQAQYNSVLDAQQKLQVIHDPSCPSMNPLAQQKQPPIIDADWFEENL
jgi:hypothetical protein